MRHRRRVCALLWGCLRVSLFALATATQLLPQASTSATLAGTVVNSVTKQGIPHALVTFAGAATGSRFTDNAGTFRVDDVPEGNYFVTVMKPGYVSEQELAAGNLMVESFRNGFNQEPLTQNRPPRPVATGFELKHNSEPRLIKLVPTSSVIGIVLDENAQPIPGITVQAIAVHTTLTGTDYQTAMQGAADDRGQFEFLDLTPGDYLVRLAGEASSTSYASGSINPVRDHRGMRPVYYPDAEGTISASVQHLSPGEQVRTDFQHPTEPAFDISGHLAGFVRNAWTQFHLYREGDPLPVARAFVNLVSGVFRVIDVPPGEYIMRVAQYQSQEPQWRAAVVPVSISSTPLENLAVELSAGGSIPVSISYESGAEADGRVNLSLQPRNQQASTATRFLMAGKQAATPGMHGTAEQLRAAGERMRAAGEEQEQKPTAFDNVIPDSYRLTANAFGSGKDYVAAATLGGQDILHRDFLVTSASPGELRIVIKGDSAAVQGQVAAQGKPALGAVVYLIPTAVGVAELKFGASDENGHYQIEGVPPGDYRIVAWTRQPTPAQALAGTGTSVSLQSSETRTLDIEAVQNGQWGASPEAAEGQP